MNNFIKKFLLFCSIPFFSTVLLFFSITTIVRNGEYFSLDKSVKNLIIGHSHPQFAFNDSLISNTRNLSEGGTNYFYVSYRIEKILHENPQIENIFIDLSNNLFYETYNENIYATSHLPAKYAYTASFISINDNIYLASKNFNAYIKGVFKTIYVNGAFLLQKKKNYIDWDELGYGWGKYRFKSDTLNILAIDTLDKEDYKKQTEGITFFENPAISINSIKYLNRVIEKCRTFNVNIYLIRVPIHKDIFMLKNEIEFRKVINNKYRKYEFLDFKDFPLKKSDFVDFGHLNYKGAKKFSIFFNNLLNNGLLNVNKKQEFINSEIEKIKK